MMECWKIKAEKIIFKIDRIPLYLSFHNLRLVIPILNMMQDTGLRMDDPSINHRASIC